MNMQSLVHPFHLASMMQRLAMKKSWSHGRVAHLSILRRIPSANLPRTSFALATHITSSRLPFIGLKSSVASLSSNATAASIPDNGHGEGKQQEAGKGAEEQPPPKADKALGLWLFASAGLVFGMVVLGGVTRLTESGLSMVDWSLLHVKAPGSQEEWLAYFDKYKQSPEYLMLNQGMTLDEFKRIYYFEHSHRMLGRLIGVVYTLPMVYFLIKRRSTMPSYQKKVLLAISGLILGQGLLGWYMVKSGLEPSLVEQGKHPRVSQYRLAAHLGSAFVIFLLMLKQGLNALYPGPFDATLACHSGPLSAQQRLRMLKNMARLNHGLHAAASLVFLTAMSGALVAGLDAGLVYNTWPKMGNLWVPDETLEMRPAWRNFLENPVTVQLDHRCLAYASTACIAGLWAFARAVPLPRTAKRATHLILGGVLVQATLGITTLLYIVPIPLAAAHQAGSLTLLGILTWMMHVLRRIRL